MIFRALERQVQLMPNRAVRAIAADDERGWKVERFALWSTVTATQSSC